MPKLDKSTVALTFKFDCDRFLRYRLATSAEIKAGVPNSLERRGATRPGINLITAQGRAWEASCYDDIVRAAPERTVWVKGNYKEDIGRNEYGPVKDLLPRLKAKTPPAFVIEAEFEVPGSISRGLSNAIKTGRLSQATARPDLIWIQPFDPTVPLVEPAAADCEYIIHVVDVKLAAEPSLRHFVEVTFYALGLQAYLNDAGRHDAAIGSRFAVAAEARVWPGTHDASSFRILVAKLQADGEADPTAAALLQTTRPVPYEVYKPRLQQFLDMRLPAVLQAAPQEAKWHVSKRCQLCDFFDDCLKEARDPAVDHLSQISRLTAGHAQILRNAGIANASQLKAALEGTSPQWAAACSESHSLRALESSIRAQTEALAIGTVVPIPGRRTVAMPRFAHLNILLTTHFDPGTGITFAFGARKVHFKDRGLPPVVEDVVFPVDSINAPGNLMSPKTEGDRLAELCEKIKGWLEHLDDANKVLPKEQKQSAHFYLWEAMEARQLARAISRHLVNDAVMNHAGFLLRVFPPEMELRSADDLASQPVTIVKPVVQSLLALPVPFEFTLMDARNILDPFVKDGEQIRIQHPWGFATPMSDQIPLERAYEVWQGRPILRKWDPVLSYAERPKYSREEIRDEIKRCIKRHLDALGAVVQKLRGDYRSQLLLTKEPFKLKDAPQMQLPANSVMVYTLERLSSVAADLESREILALPLEEREAHFHSARGLHPAAPSAAVSKLEGEVRVDPRYASELAAGTAILHIFEFGQNSRDTRLRDGTFTVVLRNEDDLQPLETRWYRAAGYTTYDAAVSNGFCRGKYREYESLKVLLQVTIARIESMEAPPLVAVIFDRERLEIATKVNLLNFDKAMVLDPIYRDFSTSILEAVVRRIGGKKK